MKTIIQVGLNGRVPVPLEKRFLISGPTISGPPRSVQEVYADGEKTIVNANGETGIGGAVNFNRHILTLVAVAVMLATPCAFSQFGRSNGEPEDSGVREVKAKRKQLEQDGMNIAIHEITIREFELKGQKISRQLYAILETHQGRLSTDMQKRALDLLRELQGLESDIKKRKAFVDNEKMLLDLGQRQLAFDEQRSGAENGYRNLDSTVQFGDFEKSIQRQNERLIQDERQPWRISPIPVADGSDPNAGEMKLCEMLEAKAGQNGADIAGNQPPCG